jgi:DNA-binding protein H-NS
MKDYNLDTKDWDTIKKHFIKKFEPKSTAKTSCANLVELSQRPGESATKFHFRLFKIYERLCEARPATIYDVTFAPANPAAATADELKAIKKEGIEAMEMYIKHQLFVAGLREPLRSEVMKEGKATLGETVDLADELESIYRKNERTVNAVITEENEDAAAYKEIFNIDELDDDELEAINSIRQKSGKKPFFRKNSHNRHNNGNNSNGNNNGNNPVKCRYCKKPNHMQKDCRARRRDKAPMVDANGKPYTKKINAVEDGKDATENSEVSALNWI